MENTLAYSQAQDQADILKDFRHRFHLPKRENGKPWLYFTGNSLGLQPKSAEVYLSEEMQKWAELGVEGHFRGDFPWLDYHKHFKPAFAYLTGSNENEVTPMGSLSANLHFLLASFYKPQGRRNKILLEAHAFPSDQYVLETQARFHQLDPNVVVIELMPRPGEHTLRTEDIVQKINELGEDLALVMLGGVNYYTGQVFDIQAITQAAHQVGAYAGFDLAHAIGNVPLALHTWEVDFAAWCSYKYLNSSPGGIGGIYVHQKHHPHNQMPRLAGWWGYEEATRFKMQKGFKPITDVDAWQLSNVPILLLAVHRASLEIFMEAKMENLRAKSKKLTAFLAFVIQDIAHKTDYPIEILTPANPAERGCQLSLWVVKSGKKLFQLLQEAGVMADWREPDVIRVAPVPLYNTFEEVYVFGEALQKGIARL
jgi:kynureninase